MQEATADAIRRVYESSGELAAVVELRRHFPLYGNSEQARTCVQMIASWIPIAPRKPAKPPRNGRTTVKKHRRRRLIERCYSQFICLAGSAAFSFQSGGSKATSAKHFATVRIESRWSEAEARKAELMLQNVKFCNGQKLTSNAKQTDGMPGSAERQSIADTVVDATFEIMMRCSIAVAVFPPHAPLLRLGDTRRWTFH